MEKLTLFHDNMKASADDLKAVGQFARDSLDHVVNDGISSGKGYVGFNAAKTAQTEVTVAAGRLYAAGKVYFTDAAEELDLLASLPLAAKSIAAIVVYGSEIDTVNQSREFLIDVETRQTEGRVVATQNWRKAVIGTVIGAEAPTPLRPAVDSQYTVIAWVTMNNSGVETVEMSDDTHLRSTADAYALAKANSAALASLEPRLATFESDITRLARAVDASASNAAIIRVMEELAQVKDYLSLPSTYVDFDADRFLTEDDSDLTEGAYDAKIMDGLRFPDANTTGPAGTALVLANPADANINTHSNTVLMPKYEKLRWREVGAPAGDLALNQFGFENSAITVANMSRYRTRMGSPFMVSSASSWWGTASYVDPAAGILTKNGETFQALPTNQYDSDGHQMYRVQKQWVDDMSNPYWVRTSSPGALVVGGYPWVQSFLCSQDMWVAGVSIAFSRLDTSGGVTFGLCEIKPDGTPDFDKMLNTVNVAYGDLQLWTSGFSKVYDFPPTFLQSGKYYGWVIITSANHWVKYADAGQGGVTGNLFFRTTGNVWQVEPTKNMSIQLYVCNFASPRTEVQFEPVTLAGGINAIDILADAIIPASTQITWQVQVGGVWKDFDPAAASPLAALPTLVGLRAILTGTKGMQPALKLTGARVICSRPATALKHYSATRTLPSAVTTVHMKARLEGFSAGAGHSCALKVKAGGTEYAHTSVVDTVVGMGIDGRDIIERKAVFTIPSGTTYKRVIEGGATNVEDQFTVAQIVDVGVS